MSREQMPQENSPELPYLTRVQEFVEQVFNEEQAALRRSMGENYLPDHATTWRVRDAVEEAISSKKKQTEQDTPVNISASTLSEAMNPFVSLATILTQAGKCLDEIDPFAVGNILEALCFYANKKTGGYPSVGEYF